MKKTIKSTLAILAFSLVSNIATAQYHMDSDGKTLRNSSNSSVGRIDSNGTIVNEPIILIF